MPDAPSVADRNLRRAAVQLGVLVGLCLVVFRTELLALKDAVSDWNAAHALAAPLLIFLIAYRRRQLLLERLAPGSAWGVVVLLLSLVGYALSTWPFNYGSPRRIALVPALGASVLAVGGWRVLKLCLPMLLILLIAIPVGSRYYAFAIIKPETYTLGAVRATLDLLPGVFVELEGQDLSYFGSRGSGTIALGEHHRGAALLVAYLTIVIFVAFDRIRPWWELIAFAVAAPLIVFFCNYVRVLAWGLITIYGGATPTSPWPRLLASGAALAMAYAMSLLLGLTLAKAVITGPPPPATTES